jgi:hypothetical protein
VLVVSVVVGVVEGIIVDAVLVVGQSALRPNDALSTFTCTADVPVEKTTEIGSPRNALCATIVTATLKNPVSIRSSDATTSLPDMIDALQRKLFGESARARQ